MNNHILSAMKRKDVERASMLLLTPGYDVNTVSRSAGTPLNYATKMGIKNCHAHKIYIYIHVLDKPDLAASRSPLQ